MKRQTKDITVILDVVATAHRERVALWQAADQRIGGNLASMRRRRAHQATHPKYRAMDERIIRRLKTDNRRTRRLVKTFASWQRPTSGSLTGAHGRVTSICLFA